MGLRTASLTTGVSHCDPEIRDKRPKSRDLTAAGFVGVVTTVIHAVAFPNQADAHSILALETELVTDLVELGVLG